MKEDFVFFDQKEFEHQLEINGKILALANPSEVYWGPENTFHEQIAYSLGKDPRLDENIEWFEQFVRLFYNLEAKEVEWSFFLVASEDPYQHKRKVKQYYNLGLKTIEALKSKYPQFQNLVLKIHDNEKMLEQYSCVSTFREINGQWKLVEMSLSEERKGLTLEQVQLKYDNLLKE